MKYNFACIDVSEYQNSYFRAVLCLFSQMMFMCVQAWVRVWQTQTCWKLKPRLYEAGNPLEDITKIFYILINFKVLKMCTSVQLYLQV